jgi:alpha-tubulin suppressor-like RCC1 family protein
VVASLFGTTLPAQAASPRPAVTHLHAAVTPTTARLRTVIVITGTATPALPSVPVTVQRLVGKKWTTLARVRTTAKGAFTLRLRAPKKAATWVVRLTRAATRTTRAAMTPVVHVHLVKTAFAVTAAPVGGPVHQGGAVVLAGTVRPATRGSVLLQRLAGTGWTTVAHATLDASSAFSVSTAATAGAYTLRVVKPFSKTVATGSSPSVAVTVLPPLPPAPPVITTTGLPAMFVGRAYKTVLAATGTGTLTWALASGTLPAGLSLSAAGVLSGRPTVLGASRFTVTARDVLGQTTTATFAPSVAGVALRSWGYNGHGGFGNGMNINSTTPVVAESPGSSWQTIVGSDAAAVGLRADGTVCAWGANDQGQIGAGYPVDNYDPTQLTGVPSAVSVSAGGSSAFAVTSAGELWAWGNNDEGELGNGSTTESDVPVMVPGLNGVVAVSAGKAFVLALRSDGSVWSWGSNGQGQLGIGSVTPQLSPVQVLDIGASTNTKAVAIATGAFAGYALLADGTVRAWGEGGALGNGTFSNLFRPQVVTGLTDITAVAAGVQGAVALHADGTVSTWGKNDSGQLGNNSHDMLALVPVTVPGLTGVTAIASAADARYAARSDGTVMAWGLQPLGGDYTEKYVPTLVAGLTGVVDIGAGLSTGYAIVAG